MIFFIDVGFFAFITIMVGVGTIGAVTNWILNHLILMGLLLILKSMLLLSGSGLFVVKENSMHTICAVVVLLLDVVRNMLFLFCIAQMMGGAFSGGLFKLLLGIFDILIGGAILFCTAEGPMFLVYEDGLETLDSAKFSVLIEFLSILATLIVAWWGGVF